MNQHTKPCTGCPWRKDSAPGWLGASTPEEFVKTSDSEALMPCHTKTDYEDPEWKTKVACGEVPQCAGRAVHFANRFKLPRNPYLLRAVADRELVFTSPEEFIKHHRSLGIGSWGAGDD